jgi:hypothetical protein
VSVKDAPTLNTGAGACAAALLCEASTLLDLKLLTAWVDGMVPPADTLRCVQCVVGNAALLGGGAGVLVVMVLLPPAMLSIAKPASSLFCMRLVLPIGGRFVFWREMTLGRELI